MSEGMVIFVGWHPSFTPAILVFLMVNQTHLPKTQKYQKLKN
jgi:hypothetical protein